MARLELANENCLSVDIGDTRYDAKGTGYVEVTRPEHIEIAKHTALRLRGQQFSFEDAPGVTCHECGFEQLIAFSSKPCPRCGTAFERELQHAS